MPHTINMRYLMCMCIKYSVFTKIPAVVLSWTLNYVTLLIPISFFLEDRGGEGERERENFNPF